jgi:hypothetical protein
MIGHENPHKNENHKPKTGTTVNRYLIRRRNETRDDGAISRPKKKNLKGPKGTLKGPSHRF